MHEHSGTQQSSELNDGPTAGVPQAGGAPAAGPRVGGAMPPPLPVRPPPLPAQPLAPAPRLPYGVPPAHAAQPAGYAPVPAHAASHGQPMRAAPVPAVPIEFDEDGQPIQPKRSGGSLPMTIGVAACMVLVAVAALVMLARVAGMSGGPAIVRAGVGTSADGSAAVAVPAPTPPPAAKPSDPAAVMRLANTTQTLRSQLMLYKLQHRDELPDFDTYSRWEQFTKRTTAAGSIVRRTGVHAGTAFGPYVQSVPVNDLNGFSGVAVVDEVPEPNDPIAAGAGIGFVVERSTGKLFATDASGQRMWDEQAEVAAARTKLQPGGNKPTSPLGASLGGSKPSAAANVAQAERMTQTLRSQFALYALQHHDRYPNLTQYPDWQQLTKQTDPLGIPKYRGGFGPYLEEKPFNPLTGTWRPQVVVEHPGPGFRTQPGVAWVVHQETGKVWAADGKGGVLPDR